MAYVDQHTTPRLKPVAAVALVHLAIGYAFISGLAGQVIEHVPAVFRVISIDAPAPPTPNDPTPPPPAKAQPQQRIDAPMPTVDLPRAPDQSVIVPLLPPVIATRPETVAPVLPPPLPPVGSQASTAQAKGNRAGWITADDYPTRSLRNAEEGTVAISVRIGADGRVSDCTVTASSGFALLDEATCRLYQRRARFTPARDASGQPIATSTTDRIRWTMPL